MEEWRNIEGYEGLYQISNYGRVRSLKFGKERILKPGKSENGYLIIAIFKNGKGKMYLVHRLVAQAFINNTDNLPIINHKDECKTNNNVENLEWCDYIYNNNYGTTKQRIADKLINGKRSKKVFQFTLDGEFVAEYSSTMEVQRQTGYSQGHISQCCNGKRQTAYGYKWTY